MLWKEIKGKKKSLKKEKGELHEKVQAKCGEEKDVKKYEEINKSEK